MPGRGRRSAVELATPIVMRLDHRPEPPAELTHEAAAEWTAIVNRMPPDWFGRQDYAGLVALCCRIVDLRELRRELRRIVAAEGVGSPAAIRLRVDIRAEGQARLYEERALRLTKHARQDSKKTSGTPARKPWEQTA